MTTYYQQVKTAVDPHLEFYRDDLLKHDKAALRNYRGEFIHGSRDSGTDLIRFDNIDTVKAFEYALVFTLRGSNARFLHGLNGKVKPITRERAIDICRAAASVLAAKEARARTASELPTDRDLYQRLKADYLRHVPATGV